MSPTGCPEPLALGWGVGTQGQLLLALEHHRVLAQSLSEDISIATPLCQCRASPFFPLFLSFICV